MYFWLTLVEVNWWQGEECKIVSFVLRGGGSCCCCCYKSYFIIILFLIFLFIVQQLEVSFCYFFRPISSDKRDKREASATGDSSASGEDWKQIRPDFFCHASRLTRSHPRACPALTAACLKNVIDDAYPVGNLKSSSILCLNIIFHFISQVSYERPYLPQ